MVTDRSQQFTLSTLCSGELMRGPRTTICSPDKNHCCISANAMQHSSSIVTASGTQICKMIKDHPSLLNWTNLVDPEFPMLYTKIQEHLDKLSTSLQQKGPMCNLENIGQGVTEKLFKDFAVLYMYIAQGKGR